MTGLLEKALQRVRALSNQEQDAIAAQILETLDAEESWTEAKRDALDAKIDRVLDEAASGRMHGPEDALRKLAALRDEHLAQQGR